jgi:hypothetical protein
VTIFLQQRNLKQKFISLLKRFRISEDLDNDPEEIEQKLSGGSTLFAIPRVPVKLMAFCPRLKPIIE